MKQVYMLAPCRTAVGSFGGSLKEFGASELGTVVIRETMKRSGVSPE